MNWINPEQNLVGAVKQLQEVMQGECTITDTEKFSLQQCKDAFFKKTGSTDGAVAFRSHYGSQKWLKGNGLPISNLHLQVANWLNNPKQQPKEDDAQECVRKAMQYAEESRNRREGTGTFSQIVPGSVSNSGEDIF